MAVIVLSGPCYAPAGQARRKTQMRQLVVSFVGLRAGVIRALAGVVVILLLCSGVWAQKSKKNQPAPDQPLPSMPMSDNDKIERAIGETLAAQQLGNLE